MHTNSLGKSNVNSIIKIGNGFVLLPIMVWLWLLTDLKFHYRAWVKCANKKRDNPYRVCVLIIEN